MPMATFAQSTLGNGESTTMSISIPGDAAIGATAAIAFAPHGTMTDRVSSPIFIRVQ